MSDMTPETQAELESTLGGIVATWMDVPADRISTTVVPNHHGFLIVCTIDGAEVPKEIQAKLGAFLTTCCGVVRATVVEPQEDA